jgi:DNA-binding SARP family transcriptional activator
MSLEPPLRIQALGPTRVGSQSGGWIARRPGQLLKLMLARRGRASTVDEIVEALWPGSGYGAAGNVRYYVHVLRKALAPHGALVRCGGGGYALDMSAVALDAEEFETALARGDLREALSLYTGDFLADEPYAEWAQSERQRLHELACEALRALAQELLAGGELAGAQECLARLAEMAPYDEDVHRELIALEIARGRRSDALRRYEALRHRMRAAFAEEPSFTLAELCRAPALVP